MGTERNRARRDRCRHSRTGHFTVLAQIVADVLGVAPKTFASSPAIRASFTGARGMLRASRGAVVAGSAHAAAISVRGKILDLASSILGVAADKLELGGSRVKIAGSNTPGIAFGDPPVRRTRFGRRPSGTEPGLESTALRSGSWRIASGVQP